MTATIDSKMFHPILTLQDRALWLASLHPRSADYIKQAPVLVAASMAYEAASLRSAWIEMCERGEKLGAMLDLLGLNRGLRSANAKAFLVSHAHELLKLKVVNPSTLSQQLSSRTPEQQKQLFDVIKPISEWTTGQQQNVFGWLIEHLPVTYPEMTHIRDFFRSNFGHSFKPTWKWRDLLAGIKHWEEEFAKLKAKEEAKYNLPLTPHTQAPKEWRSDPKGGIVFKMLNTENELRLEGAHMHHCVAGYHEVVRRGNSLIYAASDGDKRKGTLELRSNPYQHAETFWVEKAAKDRTPVVIYDEDDMEKHPNVKEWSRETRNVTRYRWTIAQFKTYHNGQPDTDAQHAARKFADEGFLYPDEIKAREKGKASMWKVLAKKSA